MRNLSETLIAAQKEATRTPYVKLEAKNKIAGVVRYDWSRLYNGSEEDYFHAVTMPGDGSLIRVRVTPLSDARKLYRQRVADPAPGSDFSQWTYTNQYNVVIVAGCSYGTNVSIFWIKSDRKIYQQESTDYGVNWGTPQLLGYTPTTAIYGIAAAYRPDGDITLFFADQATLYVVKRVDGSWGSSAAWDKSTGDLSGVATVYDGDWNLVVTGKDSSNNYKLWSLVYGDGGEVTADTWSELKEIAVAPSDGDFQYHRAFLDKPDVFRTFYVEKFTGTQSYNRPFWSYSVPDTAFTDNLWHEPVPFNLSAEYGLAIAHYGDYCWLSNPGGVWRASKAEQTISLTADVLSLKQETAEKSDRLLAELRNDEGQYAAPGQGNLQTLDIGCQLEFSPGYLTTAGNEISSGQTFLLDAYEHTSSAGKASLMLYASGGWELLNAWIARYHFRWNKSSDQMSVKQILEFVLSRVGLKLDVISQSSVITSYYPDFAINPNNSGGTVVSKLLSCVPDVLLIEGGTGYIINPLATDNSVYSYGADHPIFEGGYRNGAWAVNRVQVEGYDPVSGEPIIVDSFAWDEIDRVYDQLRQVGDKNVDTVAGVQARGESYLREAEIGSGGGVIKIPVNCGQQLYDVIDITDIRAGLSAEKKRVLGLTLNYNPLRGEYLERLSLGKV